MRIAVIGLGGVGGLYGGLLQKAGHQVEFLVRSGAEAWSETGLKVFSPWGDFFLPQVKVFQRVAEMAKPELIIVASKAFDFIALHNLLKEFLRDKSTILFLQNGFHPEQAAEDLWGEERILTGLCFLCSRRLKTGVIEHQDFGSITLAGRGGAENGSVVAGIADLFKSAGIDILVEDEWRKARWKKLLWNIPFNGLCTVYGVDTSGILGNPEWRREAEMVMRETRLGAQCQGVSLREDLDQKLFKATESMRPYKPSMLLDWEARREMEVEAIHGDTLAAILGAGFSVPHLENLTSKLRSMNARI